MRACIAFVVIVLNLWVGTDVVVADDAGGLRAALAKRDEALQTARIEVAEVSWDSTGAVANIDLMEVARLGSKEKWVRRNVTYPGVAIPRTTGEAPAAVIAELKARVAPSIDVYDGGRHLSLVPRKATLTWDGTLGRDLDTYMRRGGLKNGMLTHWERWFPDTMSRWTQLREREVQPDGSALWLFTEPGPKGRAVIYRLIVDTELRPTELTMTRLKSGETAQVSGAAPSASEEFVLRNQVVRSIDIGAVKLPECASTEQVQPDGKRYYTTAWYTYQLGAAASPDDFNTRAAPTETRGGSVRFADALTGEVLVLGDPTPFASHGAPDGGAGDGRGISWAGPAALAGLAIVTIAWWIRRRRTR